MTKLYYPALRMLLFVMKITFIRHSKTLQEPEVYNPLWQLNEVGTERAIELSKTKEIKDLDLIYSSGQTKAIQTMLYLAKDNHLKMHVDDDFTEITSITNKYIEDFETALYELHTGVVERINDGETSIEARDRFNNALDRLVLNHPDANNIGIVSHGNILSVFSSQYIDKSSYEIHKTLKMPDVAIFDYDKKSFIKFFGE